MGVVKKLFLWSQVVLSMLLVQLFATGMQLLSKVILNQGTFIFALMAYRHVVAAVCVAPFAFYFERGVALKKLRWSVWFWLFINALAGITAAMGLYYYGLRDTSATYSTNFLNLIPICTFIASTLFGMEKLGLKTWPGRIKTLGAILCVAGALTTSLYKGKGFYIHHHSHDHSHTSAVASKSNWTRGTLFLVGSCLSYSTWYMVQVKVHKIFPSKYWVTMLTCIIASVQATVAGLCLDRRKSAWSLDWNLQLLTIFYSGALGHSCYILHNIMGNLSSRADLSPNVQSSDSNFCGHIRSFHTWRSDQSWNLAGNGSDHSWFVLILVGEEKGAKELA
ncbi:WAT1-related protein [Quillaja saponaria]|uniref:WAT1-related protein n=1 Tax=Quillaja saponaria TaxID=32244 RepID=A0AAD7LVV3_QUISA|nr:WAT1-related protein [Quillaja saponaria]